jgi:hypothetical protein
MCCFIEFGDYLQVLLDRAGGSLAGKLSMACSSTSSSGS